MIGAGFIAGGPSRAFYNRRRSAVIPLAPDTWQGLGTTNDLANVGGISDIQVPGLGIAKGETLFVCLECDGVVNVDNLNPTFAGQSLTSNGNFIIAGVSGIGIIPMYVGNNTGGDLVGTLDLDMTGSTALPTIACLLYSRVSTLNVAILSRDRLKGGTGTSGTQDSGLSVATNQAKEFLWGNIGTNGFAVDALGAWQTAFTAGQRASNVAGLDLKEGYRFVNAISTYRSEVTGATIRSYRSELSTYRGI